MALKDELNKIEKRQERQLQDGIYEKLTVVRMINPILTHPLLWRY